MFNCYLYRIAEPEGKLRQPEKLLYLTWFNQNFSQTNLVTVQGESLSVIFPGKRNPFEGPDFKEAMIIIGKRVLKGDVEIHWRSSDWYNHNHECDEKYDNVILHVVVNHDIKNPIRTKSGKLVSTFVLKNLAPLNSKKFPCENWPKVDEEKSRDLFHQYYQKRWQRKTANWQRVILRYGVEQAFYLGWMDVLGYSQNRMGFQKLAHLLPIEKIYNILGRESGEKIPILEAILLGLSGFLEYYLPPGWDKESTYFKVLKENWCQLQIRYGLKAGQDFGWHFAGIRPANYPNRRLLGLAQTLIKFYPNYPITVLSKKLKISETFEQFYQWFRETYQEPEGIWKNHPLMHGQRACNLMGTERLNDMLINLIFPFISALGVIENDEDLIQKSSILAKEVSSGEIPNVVSKMLKRLHLPSTYITHNWIIQGILEYLQYICEFNLCSLCQLEEYAVK